MTKCKASFTRMLIHFSCQKDEGHEANVNNYMHEIFESYDIKGGYLEMRASWENKDD